MSLPFLRRVGDALYFDHGGKPRHWEPLGSNEEAAMRRYRILLKQRNATGGTVDAMLRDHLLTLPTKVKAGELTASTLKQYKAWRMHVGEMFGRFRPHEVTQADILRYLENCPRTSFRGEISLLSSAYWTWMRLGKVAFNPCAGVRTKRKRSKRDRLLEFGELDAVGRASERIAVAVDLAFALGLRISDLCGLRWADFDSHVRTRKTGARQAFDRTDELDAIIARCKALQARIASPFVLCDERWQPYSRTKLTKLFAKAAKAAGVKNAQFRDIRAAAGTTKEAEEGERAAQAFLGHQDARTTKLYLRGRRINQVRPASRKVR